MKYALAIIVFLAMSLAIMAQEFYAQPREGLYVELRWNDGGGSHTIKRQLPGEATATPIVTTSATHYNDTLHVAICGDTIAYQLWAGDVPRAEAKVWFTDMMPPDAIAIQQVSTDSVTRQVVVDWLPSASNDVMAYIVCSGSPCTNPDTVYGLRHVVDAGDSPITFRIFPIDSCGNPSALSEPCNNLILSVEGDSCGGTYTARWNAYQNMPGTMGKYVLQRYDDGLQRWVAEDSTSALSLKRAVAADVIDSCRFRLRLQNNEGTSLLFSNETWLHTEGIGSQPCPTNPGGIGELDENPFFLPNAIIYRNPPNHEFRPCPSGQLPQGISDYRLDIYNRVGCRVFRSTDPSVAFDGTYKGVALGGSAYTYLIFYTYDGKQHIIKGMLLLIK